MKILFIAFSLLMFSTTWSQDTKSTKQKAAVEKLDTLSSLTVFMLHKNYSNEDIQNMYENYPKKLASLDYYYSKSFQVKEGQSYTKEQYLSIDIVNLDVLRLADKTIEIYDETARIHLVLDSQRTLKNTFDKIMNSSEASDTIKK